MIAAHLAAILMTAASCSINIEKTDVGQVVESGDLLSAQGPLGAPEGKFRQGKLTVVYHDINLGYATQYNPGGFVRFNPFELREIGLLVIPIQAAVAAGEYSQQRREALARQRGGLVVFSEAGLGVTVPVLTRHLDQPQTSLDLLARLYRAAHDGDADALALIGSAALDQKQRYLFLCVASHLGSHRAMKHLASGYFRGDIPSPNGLRDALLWAVLADPGTARRRLTAAGGFDDRLSDELSMWAPVHGSAQTDRPDHARYDEILVAVDEQMASGKLVNRNNPAESAWKIARSTAPADPLLRFPGLSRSKRETFLRYLMSWRPEANPCGAASPKFPFQ